jgi:hypothetical protein
MRCHIEPVETPYIVLRFNFKFKPNEYFIGLENFIQRSTGSSFSFLSVPQ